MKIVIGALDARMAHVSRKIWEPGVDIYTSCDPSVEITECEMMTKIIGPRFVSESLYETCILPDCAEYWAYAFSRVAFRSGCREEIDSTGIDFGNARIICPE